MADSRAPKSLRAVDAAYIAGLIDGGGTITVTRKHLVPVESRQLAVTISNKALLDFVLGAVGA